MKAASEGKNDPTPRELEVMASRDWKVYDVGLIVPECLLGAIGLVTWMRLGENGLVTTQRAALRSSCSVVRWFADGIGLLLFSLAETALA